MSTHSSEPLKTLLVIDDHEATISALKKMCEKSYNIVTASTARGAIELCAAKAPDLILMELSLPAHSGFEFLYEFRSYRDWEEVPIVVYSFVNLTETVLRSRGWQALLISAYYYKPESSIKTVVEKLKELHAS